MLTQVTKILIICTIVLVSSCAQLPVNFEAKPSYVITDTKSTQLGKKAKKTLGENTHQSKMLLLSDGVDAYVSRISLLYSAEKTIDVQYYIWHSDMVGKLLFNGLIAAADRGLRVRVLLDDMPINKATESLLYAMDQHKSFI